MTMTISGPRKTKNLNIAHSMSKITFTKMNRLFVQDRHQLVRRKKPIDHSIMTPGDCEFCGLPVIANGGQLLTFRSIGDKKFYSHKACRKNNKI